MSTAEARFGDLGAARTVDTSLGSVVVHERGPSSAPTLVLLHGILVNADLWAGVVDLLADRYRCVSVDLPLGAHHVALDGSHANTVPHLVAALGEVLESLAPSEVVLVGNDTGGALAQILVTERPDLVSGVVLTPCDAFDNFLPLAVRYTQLLARVPGGVWLMVQLLRLSVVRRLPIAFGWLHRRPLPPDLWRSFLGPGADGAVRRDVRQFLSSVSRRHTRRAAAALPDLAVPLLLVWCDHDRVFPREHAHRLAALAPDAAVVEVPDTRAFLPWDAPEELAGHLDEFVRSRISAGSTQSDTPTKEI